MHACARATQPSAQHYGKFLTAAFVQKAATTCEQVHAAVEIQSDAASLQFTASAGSGFVMVIGPKFLEARGWRDTLERVFGGCEFGETFPEAIARRVLPAGGLKVILHGFRPILVRLFCPPIRRLSVVPERA